MLEFNIATDPEAASILFSLTSRHSKTHKSAPRLVRPLNLTILPLDATHLHGLHHEYYKRISGPALEQGSPLASFLDAVLVRTYKRLNSLVKKGRESEVVELHMHDPLALHYAMLEDEAREEWVVEKNADVRVECDGTWTRGMTVLDHRERGKRPFDKKVDSCSDDITEGEDTADGDYDDVDDDEGEWRGSTGNKVNIVWASRTDGNNQKTVEEMAELIWNLKA
jgi:inosine-uridine nucleoside N-ribohydrolase